MADIATRDDYGVLIEPATLRIERLLPGSIDRIWAYLTDSDLRRKWLASGEMDLKAGAPFELVWRNDELSDPPGDRPDAFGGEHRMTCEILEVDPPHRLAFTWGRSGGVVFDLEPKGDSVLLTITHRRVPDRETLRLIAPGWHAHLDVLAAIAAGRKPQPFWDDFLRLQGDYDQRLPG